MNRSGYDEDYGCDDPLALVRYRQAVAKALKGKRGQAFLKEMLTAMDAMPEKQLVESELETPTGAVCAIGSVGKKRGVDMTKLDPEDAAGVAATFGIAESMAREIVFENDGAWAYWNETPEQRFARMRNWIVGNLK